MLYYITCQPEHGFKKGRLSNALILGEESDVPHISRTTGGTRFSQNNSRSTAWNDTTHVGPLESLSSTLILVKSFSCTAMHITMFHICQIYLL